MDYACPHCSTVLDVEEKYDGKKAQCPSCQKDFMIAIPKQAAPASAPVPIPAPVPVHAPQRMEATPFKNNNLVFCGDCGSQFSKRADKCPKCGAPNGEAPKSAQPTQVINIQMNATQQGYMGPPKKRLVYIFLALFFGFFGVHNFYAGYTGTGLIQLLLTLTVVGAILVAFWLIFDILFTSKDGYGVPFR